jgi:hypothetical protein
MKTNQKNDPALAEESILRNMRFKKSLFDKLTVQARSENRTFSNLVETILINYLKSKKDE